MSKIRRGGGEEWRVKSNSSKISYLLLLRDTSSAFPSSVTRTELTLLRWVNICGGRSRTNIVLRFGPKRSGSDVGVDLLKTVTGIR